ncbi:MAG: hypothetical protein K8T26_19855 [Lentisphaerae bacterium]|nr:hypothetical protein [Lentisphaerota bacterium]
MTELVDINGDGFADGYAQTADLNGDGYIDAAQVAADTNGDGIIDTLATAVDINGDGAVDALQLDTDFTGDGVADVSELAVDVNADGVADVTEVAVDVDQDGVADILASNDQTDSIWNDATLGASAWLAEDPASALTQTYTDYAIPSVVAPFDVTGTPAEDMALWDPQDDPASCAVATTNMLFRTVGIDVGEANVAYVFEEAGIYDPATGTDIDHIDAVIDAIADAAGLDVHAESVTGFTPESLEEMVNSGVRPLVGVDSSELYDPMTQTLNEAGLIPNAGHAVQVTGIVHTTEGDFVVINDPGFPDGAGMQIPMDQFMDAAEDYGFKAVALVDGATDSASNLLSRLAAPAVVAGGLVAAGMVISNRTKDATKDTE